MRHHRWYPLLLLAFLGGSLFMAGCAEDEVVTTVTPEPQAFATTVDLEGVDVEMHHDPG